MSLFLSLVIKISPLYFLIVLGYIAGKYLHASKETVAKILIYIIVPIVVFNSVLATHLTLNILLLPLFFFILCSVICLITYSISKSVWSDATKNILAFTSGTGNTGYFGLPVAVALFGPSVVGIVVICIFGFILYDTSIGFFIAARGHHTVRESFIKVLKLPTLYTFMLAVLLNLLGVHVSVQMAEFATLFRGTYTVLGMMLVGFGLASVENYTFDFTFLGAAFFIKFIVWPVVIFTFVWIDTAYFQLFNTQTHHVMMLLSMVPLGANTVAFATELKTHPDKAAFAVLFSTIFALFYVPFLAGIFFK